MGLLLTDAIVLHAFDYLETSRILRLVTRDAGVQSVLARGARSSRKRFGSSLDLFAQGQAQLQLKPGRELHTLVSFDTNRPRPSLGTDLGRFSAAAALAECVLHVVHEESAQRVYDVVERGLDNIAEASSSESVGAALGALWRLVAEVGFAPSVELCASCHEPLLEGEPTAFSHVAGGSLCARCTSFSSGGRTLPFEARRAIGNWMAGSAVEMLTEVQQRAHQRLFREFLAQHMPSGRPFPAFSSWESRQIAS